MKVVINSCYGGFSLSPRAVQRLAELQGRKCYFYRNARTADNRPDFDRYERITVEEADSDFMWFAFDVPDAERTICVRYTKEEWRAATDEQRKAWNEEYSRHQLDGRDWVRHDPLLVQVVEELGGEHRQGASGKCAKLSIVEIPDDVDYEIAEYDGLEHVAEKHRTWR